MDWAWTTDSPTSHSLSYPARHLPTRTRVSCAVDAQLSPPMGMPTLTAHNGPLSHVAGAQLLGNLESLSPCNRNLSVQWWQRPSVLERTKPKPLTNPHISSTCRAHFATARWTQSTRSLPTPRACKSSCSLHADHIHLQNSPTPRVCG